jgi:hypothetical protein
MVVKFFGIHIVKLIIFYASMKTFTNFKNPCRTPLLRACCGIRRLHVTLKLFQARAVILQIVPKTAHNMYEYI